MTELALRSFHKNHGANFQWVNGFEVVADYGNRAEEHKALTQGTAILDLSFRGRACLVGVDRIRFLHGQVTNDVKNLAMWTGCYSALTTSKGKMQSDLNIYRLEEELLLDFEPGFQQVISERLENFIVADDVQILEVAASYGLLGIQGPKSSQFLAGLRLFDRLPEKPFEVAKNNLPGMGEVYLINRSRVGTSGFDLFVPTVSLENLIQQLVAQPGHHLSGWQALETARIEAGIPRFGVDMDESNFPQECGIESQAVSYNKGCYIGQETLNRIHTMGHVNRQLTGMLLAKDFKNAPAKGAKLFDQTKEAGYITSSISSLRYDRMIALGYIRSELREVGGELTLRLAGEEDSRARIVHLPFQPSDFLL